MIPSIQSPRSNLSGGRLESKTRRATVVPVLATLDAHNSRLHKLLPRKGLLAILGRGVIRIEFFLTLSPGWTRCLPIHNLAPRDTLFDSSLDTKCKRDAIVVLGFGEPFCV